MPQRLPGLESTLKRVPASAKSSRLDTREPRNYAGRMLGSKHVYDLLILERHLDTFGHVNNATYLELLEQARWELITQNGYGLEEVHRRKIGPTILEVHVRFTREIRNRQRIAVHSWLESYSGKVGKFMQQMLDEDGNVCCEATFTMGLFDLVARKLIPPTPEWLRALGLHAESLPPPA